MSKTINFESLEGGKKTDKEMEGALKHFAENIGQVMEAFTIKAQMSKAYYDALILEGFTKEEALEIIKNDDSL